jgi:hypothetical protein
MQVRAAEAELRHKLFPPNAWMKVLHFNVLTSCPEDDLIKLHQLFIGLYGEHIIPANMHRYTQGITQGQARAAIFMRSTPGCGTWQAPASSGWPFGRQDRTDLFGRNKSRSEAARRAWNTKNAQKRAFYDMHIPVIYLSYMTAL